MNEVLIWAAVLGVSMFMLLALAFGQWAGRGKRHQGLWWDTKRAAWVPWCEAFNTSCEKGDHTLSYPCIYAPGTGPAWKAGITEHDHRMTHDDHNG